MKPVFVTLFLLIAACGSASQPPGAAASSASTSPSKVSAPLFAIATGLPGLQLVNSYPLPGQASVKIVGEDGRVHAQASFVPPPAPNIGNAAPLLQSPVRVAGGAVFYADSTGAVHKLKADGSQPFP